jgi:hypothetical protein
VLVKVDHSRIHVPEQVGREVGVQRLAEHGGAGDQGFNGEAVEGRVVHESPRGRRSPFDRLRALADKTAATGTEGTEGVAGAKGRCGRIGGKKR